MSHHPPETRHDVPCGFCGLLCDDLSVSVDHGRVRIDSAGCGRAAAAYEAANRHLDAGATPSIGGASASLDDAVTAAADILRAARAPLFGGNATELPGMRGVMELADATGGYIDHMNSSGMFRNLHVLQNTGWVVTTLAEVRNRVDLLVTFGTDIGSRFPRFFERCVWVDDTLFGEDASGRQVVMVGSPADPGLATSPAGRPAEVIACANSDLAEVAQALRVLVAGQPLQADAVAGIPLASLRDLAERLQGARYSVLAWAPPDLDFAHAELTVLAICDLVRELNRSTRSNGLPLGGTDGDLTAHQVCTWQTGFSMRTRLSDRGPQHDPRAYSTAALIEQQRIDALVWTASHDPARTPPAAGVPTIVLGHPAMPAQGDVFIPVGVTGIDTAGHLIRADGVVSVPTRKLRDVGLPSVGDVTTRILAALRGRAE